MKYGTKQLRIALVAALLSAGGCASVTHTALSEDSFRDLMLADVPLGSSLQDVERYLNNKGYEFSEANDVHYGIGEHDYYAMPATHYGDLIYIDAGSHGLFSNVLEYFFEFENKRLIGLQARKTDVGGYNGTAQPVGSAFGL